MNKTAINTTLSTALGLIACLPLGPGAWAQSAAPEAQQVLTLSASARKEVPQDWLSVTVRAQLEAADPSAVQSQLRTVVDAALATPGETAAGAGTRAMSSISQNASISRLLPTLLHYYHSPTLDIST